MLRKALFAIADEGSKSYEGYTLGENWNGWACPYFTREVAMEMMKEFDNEDQPAHYDEEKDAFIYVMDADHAEDYTDIYEGKDYEYNGETIRLYAIGTMAWIWTEIIEDTADTESVPDDDLIGMMITVRNNGNVVFRGEALKWLADNQGDEEVKGMIDNCYRDGYVEENLISGTWIVTFS